MRNVRRAGGCTIRWKGREFTCTEPTFVDKDVALGAARGFVRRVVERLDVHSGFLQLTRASTSGGPAAQSGR